MGAAESQLHPKQQFHSYMAKKKTNKHADIRSWISQQPSKQRPALRSAVKELARTYSKNETTSITWLHEVGELVSKFFPDGDRQYGSNIMECLAKEVDEESAEGTGVTQVLFHARVIARKLTKSEAKKWAKKKNSNGKPLPAHHVHCLAALEDKELRTELLNRCLKESWGIRRLHSKVQNLVGRKRSRGGPKPKPREVPSPIVALQEIQLEVRHWLENHEVWFKGERSALQNLGKKARTEELYQELSRALHEMIKMQKAVKMGLVCLERIATEMDEQRR